MSLFGMLLGAGALAVGALGAHLLANTWLEWTVVFFGGAWATFFAAMMVIVTRDRVRTARERAGVSGRGARTWLPVARELRAMRREDKAVERDRRRLDRDVAYRHERLEEIAARVKAEREDGDPLHS